MPTCATRAWFRSPSPSASARRQAPGRVWSRRRAGKSARRSGRSRRRTVSAYFPVKEELVFCDHQEVFDQLEQRLADRSEDATTADTLRAWLMELLEKADVDHDQSRRTRELIESDPALRTYERGLQERAEQMVAKAVAVDLGVEDDELVPHMVGAATIAALDAMGKRAKESSADEFHATALGVVEDAMAFIGGGVQALADR